MIGNFFFFCTVFNFFKKILEVYVYKFSHFFKFYNKS